MSAIVENILHSGRVSKSTVQDAEFASKRWVWLPDKQNAFVKGFVLSEDGDNLTVRCDDDTERTITSDLVEKVNPPRFDKSNDMAELTFLNEASVVHNLYSRYMVDSIYTYSGLFLVAVNPYIPLAIYDKRTIQAYKNKQREEMPPHIYAVTDFAFRSMLETTESQSILVTGESGAGKTETTKKVLQYLAEITTRPVATSTPASSGVSVSSTSSFEEQIILANPIMESFGNAQTVRNDNSSRFGKFIRIEFSRSGQISGASIDWYLLENSRVIHQTSNERNYHIFYQIIKGASKETKKSLMLDSDDLNAYAYLRNSNKSIKGVDDVKDFNDLTTAFRVMGLDSHAQLGILKMISTVLHIGNIEVGSESLDQGRISNFEQAEKVCHLLGINPEQFIKTVVKPKVKAGREWITQSRSAEQIKNSLDALSKSLYERVFGHIVNRINETMKEKSGESISFIGVLDIAGFEIFEHNSFEQLCINYTNEKLQQFFNHHMFVLEQEEYAREHIDWKFIDFGHDLQPSIDLIEKSNPMGIFSCLDEDCVMPRATDRSFTEKITQLWSKKSSKFTPSKLTQGFVLKHYASDVVYSTEGWLEKNKDPLSDNIIQLLADSNNDLVKTLFSPKEIANESSGRPGKTKRGMFRTVAQRHKEQLNNLMGQLESTHPHFVRCIIPNHEKKPKRFDNQLVLHQLRCNGVLEGIRIARSGFPNRLSFSEFTQRYSVLASSKMPKGYVESRKSCEIIIDELNMNSDLYRIGLTKIFFKSGVLAEIEEQRESIIRNLIGSFQTVARASIVRKKVKSQLFRAKAVQIIQKNFRAYNKLQNDQWFKLYLRMRPLLIASRETNSNIIADAEVKKLQVAVKKHEDISRKFEQEVEKLKDSLESQISVAADKEEILRRAQLKESQLQEELTIAYDDLDKLEAQCEELLEAKKRVIKQAEGWKTELSVGAALIATLEKEKSALTAKIDSLESEMDNLSKRRDSQVQHIQTFAEENKLLQKVIVEKDEQLESLQKELDESGTALELSSRKLKEATSENASIRGKLRELASTASNYEELVSSREAELMKLQEKLKSHQSLFQGVTEEKSELSNRVGELNKQILSHQREKKSLSDNLAQVRKEAEEARELLNANISEGARLDERHKALEKQVGQLKTTLNEKESELNSRVLKLEGELDSKKRHIEALQIERAKFVEGHKQLAISENERTRLQKDLDLERSKTKELKAFQLTVNDLKRKHEIADKSRAEAERSIESLSSKLSEASNKLLTVDDEVTKLKGEQTKIANEKEKLERALKEKGHEVESLQFDLSKHKKDIEQKASAIAALTLDKTKLGEEISEKSKQMTKLRESISSEVQRRVEKLIGEKNTLEISEKKLRIDLESMTTKCSTLERQNNKLSRDIEDLGHDLTREQKNASASQRITDSLQEKLNQLRDASASEKRNRSEGEVEKRKLVAALESTRKELEEKKAQLQTLQKVIRPKSIYHDDAETPELVDLALRLQEAEKKWKQAEEDRDIVQAQLEDAKQRWKSDLDEKDSKYYANRRALLDDLANVSSPNLSVSQPSTPQRSLRGIGTFGSRSSVSSERTLVTDDKENFSKDKQSLLSKSNQELIDMIQFAQKTKEDLLSVYHETTRNWANTKEELSNALTERKKLEAEVRRLNSSVSARSASSNDKDLELHLEAELSRNKDLSESLRLYKTRSEEYYGRLEQAETIVLKASRAETFAKSQQADAEEALAKMSKSYKEADQTISSLQAKISKLEGELEDKNIESTYSNDNQKRLSDELRALQSNLSKELNQSQSSVEAVRSRYSSEIRALAGDLEAEKLKTAQYESEKRSLLRELNTLKQNGEIKGITMAPKWKADLESQIEELTSAKEEATLAYDDSQMRIGSLLSQVRNLRSTMGDIASDRDQLQKDKRTLEQRLNEAYQRYEELVANATADTNKRAKSIRQVVTLPPDAAKQIQELKQSLSRQTEASAVAVEQLKQTKLQLQQDRDAIEQERRLNQELKKIHEKEKQSWNMRIVDMETSLMIPRSEEAGFYKAKVAELEEKLRKQQKSSTDELRHVKSVGRSTKDLFDKLNQKDKLIERLNEVNELNDQRLHKLKNSLESLQAEETSHRVAAKRAEREARAAKERALKLEKELEDWKARFGNPYTRSLVPGQMPSSPIRQNMGHR